MAKEPTPTYICTLIWRYQKGARQRPHDGILAQEKHDPLPVPNLDPFTGSDLSSSSGTSDGSMLYGETAGNAVAISNYRL